MQGFYPRLRDTRNDDPELQNCIEKVVNKLSESTTSEDNPGMLLGKIQSGKTRGFLGIITRAFDRNFDIALVFTKGTRTLAKQTVSRISNDFQRFIDNEEMGVYDIMEMPERMMRSELKRKLVIVVKKEANNVAKVIDFLGKTHPELAARRILLVDDEADMASVRFVKKKGSKSVAQGSIAQLMDDLRELVPKMVFLQVTATPYALYLQPETYSPQENQFLFFPKRPAFTELLPIHSGYVGGDDYFGNFNVNDPRHYLFVPVPIEEQDALRSADSRVIRSDRMWTSTNITVLRMALINFLVSTATRRWQQKELEMRPSKYVMVIHNDTQRQAHNWQDETVNAILHAFADSVENNDGLLKNLFDLAYADIKRSVEANAGRMPTAKIAYELVTELITEDEIYVQKVNHDVKLAPLLDPKTAELLLRTKANIFIGGSILDRGITIPALIAFYYGRSPNRMQADTVLQHSRMYGNRDRADLAVTRFYTSKGVRSRLEQIHKLESALREAFERGDEESGVVFIQNDATHGIIPCAPSKISRSDVITLRKEEFYYPLEFDTKKGKPVKEAYNKIKATLDNYAPDSGNFSTISLALALEIIENIKNTLAIDSESNFDWKAFSGLLIYYCKENNTDEVLLVVETDRDLGRRSSEDKSGPSLLGVTLREIFRKQPRSAPTLVILGQKGSKGKGWSADTPFWWPMLSTPTNAKPCVFANINSK